MLRNIRVNHNSNLPVEVYYVEERSSLKLFLQKTSLKEKVYIVNEEQPSFKVDVQNITLQVKIKQVNDQPPNSKVYLQQIDLKITSCRREIINRVWNINHIYNQRFKKYLDYCWIQQSIVQNARSKKFKKATYELAHINHSYKFLIIVCTSIKDVKVGHGMFL